MPRLVINWFETREVPGHPLAFHQRATWFSEGLVPSPFKARHRGDRRAETRTHADGLIGHFKTGRAGKTDVELATGARQFVLIEAKIRSSPSGGTLNAPTFDQAARNVACLAEVLSRAKRRPDQMDSLAFLVTAAQGNIDKGAIGANLEKSSIEAAVRSRAQVFSPELDLWVEAWFLPTLERITILPLAWECLIGDVGALDPATGQELAAFYKKCLEYN